MKWRNINQILPDEMARLRSMMPHELLNIDRQSSAKEIKIAFRKIAKAYHPDKAHPFMKKHNEQVMKLVNNAYKILIASSGGTP